MEGSGHSGGGSQALTALSALPYLLFPRASETSENPSHHHHPCPPPGQDQGDLPRQPSSLVWTVCWASLGPRPAILLRRLTSPVRIRNTLQVTPRPHGA